MEADGDKPSLPEPTPLRRVKHTLCCQNALCKLPLMQITANPAYIPLHAEVLFFPLPTPHFLLTCPACGTIRRVWQR